jgi:DNA polymerase elongation subunit (family B)
MKTCPEKEKIVFDKEQLSYKISANSFYGSFGVTRGYLAFMPCAMTITFCGRKAISDVIEIAQKNFSAKLIMSDTDSTYITFPKMSSDINKLWEHAKNVAYEITNWKKEDGTKLFPDALKLEFENVIYSKFLILAKKMYLYKSTSQDGIESEKIGKKGVVLARRDNSQAVRTAYENITKMIFDEKSVDEMKEYLSNYIKKMFSNELNVSDFIITKSIGEIENENSGKLGDYKIRHDIPEDEIEKKKILGNMTERQYLISQCPPQVQLAEKMKNRGIPVSAGSRIEYVVLKKPNATCLGQRIESFDYYFKYKKYLQIDYKYYSEALINPISQLFNTVTQKNVVEKIVNEINEEEDIKEMMNRPRFVLKK